MIRRLSPYSLSFSMCNAINTFRREFLVLFYLKILCVLFSFFKEVMNKKQSLLICFRSLSLLKYSKRVYIQDYQSSTLLCFNCAYICFLCRQLFYNTIYGGNRNMPFLKLQFCLIKYLGSYCLGSMIMYEMFFVFNQFWILVLMLNFKCPQKMHK